MADPTARDQAIEILLPGLAEHIASFREPDEDYSNRADARWLAAWFLDAIPGALHARLAADKGTLELDAIAAAVHQAYLDTCKRLGWPVKPENAVPYAELTEDAKELDRVTVRAVLAALCRPTDPPQPEAGSDG